MIFITSVLWFENQKNKITQIPTLFEVFNKALGSKIISREKNPLDR